MEARIQRNMAQAVKMEEKRKEHFWEKKAHHEALRCDLGVLGCLHAIDATRLHQTRPRVVFILILSAFRARSRLDTCHTGKNSSSSWSGNDCSKFIKIRYKNRGSP